MPIRPGKGKPEAVKQQQTKSDRLMALGRTGLFYLRLKSDGEAIETEIKQKRTSIMGELETGDLTERIGKHDEVTVLLEDGKTRIFFQKQNKESVSTVSNVIALLRSKLGAEAENYITTYQVEELHETALATLFNNGLITDKDLEEWTTTSTSSSLIVQQVDENGKKIKKK